MRRFGTVAFVVFMSVAPQLFASPSGDAQRVWTLEQRYWQSVKAGDLDQYRTLWDPEFLGWPSVSAEPLGKDHITDWITVHADKGETLKTYDLQHCSTRVAGTLATVTYRVRTIWVGKDGKETQKSTVRIIHTWVRHPDGSWQIISGMSAPTNADGL